jgi:outer membrane usher protein
VIKRTFTLNSFLLLVTTFFCFYSHTYAEQDLFEKVFKRSQTKTVEIPLFYKRSNYGDVIVKIKNSSQVTQIQASSLKRVLEKVLDRKYYDDFIKRYSAKTYLSVKELLNDKITLDYDPASLILEVRFDEAMGRLQQHNLAFNSVPRWANNAIHAKGVSGFVNIFNFYRKDTLGEQESFTSDQNLNLNYKSFALLLETTLQNDFQNSQNGQFFRRDIRFTYDQPEHLRRFQLGDLDYQTEGFQTFAPALGLLVSTNFDLNPYRLFNPTGYREITLNSPSRIRVFINDILVRTLQLPSGRHRIDNLPLNEGINNVTLEIQDKRGRIEKITFKSTTSYSLLEQGTDYYTYGVGIPAIQELGPKKYDTKYLKYFFVLNHLWGISEQFNAGYQFMGNDIQKSYGGTLRYQSLLGLSRFDLSSSTLSLPSVEETQKGIGLRLNHTFTDYRRQQKRIRTFDLSLEHLSPQYSLMGNLSTAGEATTSPEFGYTQFITDRINVRLSANYRHFSKNSVNNSYTLGSSLTGLLTNDVQLAGQYSYSHFKNNLSDHQLLVSLNWTVPESSQLLTTSYDSAQEEFATQYSFNGTGRPSSWYGDANIRTNKNQKQYEAQLGREDQYYNARANIQKRRNSNGTESTLHNINLNTSVAFAGGAWSLTRPVNNSFTLIRAEGALEDYPLFINRNEDNFEAKTNLFASAALPNQQAYRFYPIRLDSRAVPFGLKTPPSELIVASPFRGGVLLNFKAKHTRAVSGKILASKKQVKALSYGHVISLRDSNERYPFFTNRKGRFLIEALPLGSYNVVIDDKVFGVIKLDSTIPQGQILRWESTK